MRGINSSVGAAAIHARKGHSILQNSWSLAIIFAALALRLTSEATASASYFVLAAYALSGCAQAIQALALSWLFSMLSEGVAPTPSQAAIGRYAVIFAAALSVFLRNRAGSGARVDSLPVYMTLMFGAFIFLHAWFISPIVDVSMLKATAWTVAMSTLLSAWGSLPMETRKQLQAQLFGLLTAILLCSLPLLALPQGYLVNGTGFQGILSHPQGFGPTMALLGAFELANLLAKPQPRWRDMALASMCLVLVTLPAARTAGLALMLGVATAAIVAPWMIRRSVRGALPGLRSSRLQLLALFAVVGMMLNGQILTNILEGYLSKGTDAGSLTEAYDKSRGHLIDAMWVNIDAQPMTGIGFGIASIPSEMYISRDPVLGLPTGQ